MMIFDFNQISGVVDIFARGGGGGSSSGGGGGDGGILFIFGYLPTHFVGAFFRKKMYNPIGGILTAVITIGYAAFLLIFGWVGIIIAIAALVGGLAGFFGWFSAIGKFLNLSKKAKQDIVKAAATDAAWDEATMTARVKQVFMQFQKDWSTFNTESMRTYVAQPYEYHVELMLYGLKLRSRRNDMQNITIKQAFPIEVKDADNNAEDRVSYYIEASAQDSIIETIDGTETNLFTDLGTFSEIWHMVRNGNTWNLERIEQTTASVMTKQAQLEQFAKQNGLYYSLDWGWLLLPRQGVLFSKGAFGISDINNHVIGLYSNLLIEIYTYVPVQKDTVKTYTIAQVALPKRYGSIIVEAKESWTNNIFGSKPSGYNKISLEWPDFNKRYNVYATDIEQVTAFELLHPVYMEKLFSLPFKVSIEVVDNVVYLYSTDQKADYATMLSLLKDAFKEMRL